MENDLVVRLRDAAEMMQRGVYSPGHIAVVTDAADFIKSSPESAWTVSCVEGKERWSVPAQSSTVISMANVRPAELASWNEEKRMKVFRLNVPKQMGQEIADGDIVEVDGVRYIARKDVMGWRLLTIIQTKDGLRKVEKRVKESPGYAADHHSC